MPLQNRVKPEGETSPQQPAARYGNRGGCLNRPEDAGPPRWVSRQWIAVSCISRRIARYDAGASTLSCFFSPRHRAPAGHRPCFDVAVATRWLRVPLGSMAWSRRSRSGGEYGRCSAEERLGPVGAKRTFGAGC